MVELKVMLCEGSIHLPNLDSTNMERRVGSAVFLALIMLLSGCFGNSEPTKEDDGADYAEISANITTTLSTTNPSVGDILIIEADIKINPENSQHTIETNILTPSGIRVIETTLSDTNDGVRLIFMPDEPGEWLVNLRLINAEISESVQSSLTFFVEAPNEGDTILTVGGLIELDVSSDVVI